MTLLTILNRPRKNGYFKRVLSTRAASLIAYWPLWEPSGTVAVDLSGNGRNGVYTGVTLGQAGIGDGRTSALFDGATSWVDILSAGLTTHPNLNLLPNPGLELYTGTPDDDTSDTFTSWTSSAVNDPNGNKAEATATAHAGAAALKLSRGTGSCSLFRDIQVVAGTVYDVVLWTQGDGTRSARYAVYDNTHAAFITAATSTGVTAAAWTQVTTTFTAPAGCTSVRFYLYNPATAGFALFDDVSVKPQTGSGFNPDAGTVAAWVNIPAAAFTDNTYRAVIRLGSENSNYVQLMKDNDPQPSKMEGLYYGSGADAVSAEAPNQVLTGWHHVALTWNRVANEFLLYEDGALASVQAGPAMLPLVGALVATQTAIGRGYDSGYYFSGNMAHVSLWNAVLSAGEIAALARV